MANLRNRFPARRRFLKQSAALTAASASISPILALATPAESEVPVDAGKTPAGATPPAQHRRRVTRASGEGGSS